MWDGFSRQEVESTLNFGQIKELLIHMNIDKHVMEEQ
jgi:hypothetical protein